jgi:hypothetical protein
MRQGQPVVLLLSVLTRFKSLIGLETKSSGISSPEDWLFEAFGAQPSAAGIAVSPRNAIKCAPVRAAVAAISEPISTLPLHLAVREIGFDPAYASAVIALLSGNHGDKIVTIRQGWVTQSPALNTLERAIIGGNFRHGGHPVLRWCFGNVAIHTDSNNNRTMHKGKSTDRIDGAAASWMAVSRAAAGNSGLSFLDDPNVTADDLVLAA